MIFAPIVDHLTFTAQGLAGQQNVADLAAVPIYGIVISNRAIGTGKRISVEMFNGPSSTPANSIGEIEVNFSRIQAVDIPFFADKGLSFQLITDGADVGDCSISVYRGHPGT